MLVKKVDRAKVQKEVIQAKKRKERVEQVEKAWEKYAFARLKIGEDEAANTILKNVYIRKLINGKANKYYMSHRKNSRICYEDFQSDLLLRAWKVIADHSWNDGTPLYLKLNNALEQAAIDCLKVEGLHKSRYNSKTIFHSALSITLKKGEDTEIQFPALNEDTEYKAITAAWMETELNEQETKVMNVLREDPAAKLEDVRLISSFNHRTQVSRTIRQIERKLKNDVGIKNRFPDITFYKSL